MTELVDQLVREATEFYNLSEGAFFSKQRGYATRAREAVGRVLIDRMGWKESRVAQFFRKDKGAIYDNEARAKQRLKDDPIFFELVERLQNMVSPA